jgi:thiamine biosynthesis protein ThiS
MYVIINGQRRELAPLVTGNSVQDLIAALELKGDRIAVEHNGTIVRRPDWIATPVTEGDSFEIVHFVGGGCEAMGAHAHEPGMPGWANGILAFDTGQAPALLRWL